MNYQQWLQQATQALNQANSSENGRIDALALLQSVTQKSRAFILAFGETALEKKNVGKTDRTFIPSFERRTYCLSSW